MKPLHPTNYGLNIVLPKTKAFALKEKTNFYMTLNKETKRSQSILDFRRKNTRLK